MELAKLLIRTRSGLFVIVCMPCKIFPVHCAVHTSHTHKWSDILAGKSERARERQRERERERNSERESESERGRETERQREILEINYSISFYFFTVTTHNTQMTLKLTDQAKKVSVCHLEQTSNSRLSLSLSLRPCLSISFSFVLQRSLIQHFTLATCLLTARNRHTAIHNSILFCKNALGPSKLSRIWKWFVG